MRSLDALKEALDRRANDGTGRYFNEKRLFATDALYGDEGQNARGWRRWALSRATRRNSA